LRSRGTMASKGRKKDSIHTLSRHWPTPDEVTKLLDHLDEKQPNIVVAILGVAMVEYDLERLLRPRFRRSDDATWLRLTSENGPANSFSQKINLAFAFGIIDEKRRKALIAIKNVRNVFAHSKKLIEFNDPLIVEELSEVKIADRKHARTFASMMKERRGLLASYRQAKGAFIYL